MLFGIADPNVAATALDLVFEDTEYGAQSVEKRVAVTKAIEAKKDKKGKEIAAAVPSKIVISFTNFQFSSPKMTVKVKSSQLSKFKSKQKSLVKTYRAKNAKNKG
jgi:hypothetical protein